MSRRSKHSGGRRGFTLIELLIALMLLGLVLTLVYGAFAQISGPAVDQRNRLNEQQDLRLLLRMMADDLQAAQWLDRFWAKGIQYRTGIIAETRTESGKEFTRISFHTARPARFFRTVDATHDPDLHEVGYSVELSEDRSQLVLMRREDFYLDDDLEHGGVSVQLADHIQKFLVEFLPTATDERTSDQPWETRWDSPNRPESSRMPVALRLTIARTGIGDRLFSESIEFNLPASLKL
jgi:prepilin-type N-terminal cleavage/methylation domain-containing protein